MKIVGLSLLTTVPHLNFYVILIDGREKFYRVIIILTGPELVLFFNMDIFLFLLILAMLWHAGS